MGDSNDSFTKLEQHESKMQSTKAPDMLGNLMCTREALDVVRSCTKNSSVSSEFLPNTDFYQFDGSVGSEHSEKSVTNLSSAPAPADKNVYRFDGSPIDQGYYKFDGSPTDQGYYKFDGSPYVDKSQKDAKADKPSDGDKNHIQKSGKLELTFDEKGVAQSLKDSHHTFRKFDGKWYEDFDGGKNTKEIKNVEYNKKDGSYSFTNETGKFVYDCKGQLVEAPAGEGHTRKFHYDANGQVDKIDGRLGHWERQVVNGHVSWKNANGQVWNGDFKVTENGLEFRGDNGVAWGFTAQGKDVRINAKDK